MTAFITHNEHTPVLRRTFDFRVGDVLMYTPDDKTWHCREGTAVVHEHRDGNIALDTYWRGTSFDHDVMTRHSLSESELNSATLVFNLDDVEEFTNGEWAFDRYAPSDRFVVTNQHGLGVERFLRRGATEDRMTILRGHLDAALEAQRNAESAANIAAGAKALVAETFADATPEAIVGKCGITIWNDQTWCEVHDCRVDAGDATCSEFDRKVAFIVEAMA